MTSMAKLVHMLKLAVSHGIPARSFKVALVVGTILNVINQGDRIIDGNDIDLLKAILTFCTPYFVFSYGAVTALIAQLEAALARPDPEQWGRQSESGHD